MTPDVHEASESSGFEVVIFTVGRDACLVARDQVRAIRHSPRVRHAGQGRLSGTAIPVVSLSTVLGLGRDTSVDRRVLEVEHWGERVGLEVTAILGIRVIAASTLRPLPPLVRRNLRSNAVLGVAWLDGAWVVGLDTATLLVERGVEVPKPAAESG